MTSLRCIPEELPTAGFRVKLDTCLGLEALLLPLTLHPVRCPVLWTTSREVTQLSSHHSSTHGNSRRLEKMGDFQGIEK